MEKEFETEKASQEVQEQQPPIEISAEALSDEVLNAVLENFIFREGTDYGVNEVSHDTKISQVRRQLDRGDIKIVFDPNTESVTLMTKGEWSKVTRY